MIATYTPGFTADHTSWRACIFNDDTVAQTIRWCSPEKRRCYECHHETLPTGACARLLQKVSLIDFSAIQPYEDEDALCTDLSEIYLCAPLIDRGATLQPFIGYYDESDLDEVDRSRCSSFRDAWFDLRSLLPRDLNPYKMEGEEPTGAAQ